jgi:hypothetical protein
LLLLKRAEGLFDDDALENEAFDEPLFDGPSTDDDLP